MMLTRSRPSALCAALAAALFCAATPSSASLVQITLSGNYIADVTGNHLNADVTGDGTPDLTITDTLAPYSVIYSGVEATINGTAFASYGLFDDEAETTVDSVILSYTDSNSGMLSDTYFLEFPFNDSGYSPSTVSAILQIHLAASAVLTSPAVDAQKIELERVIFDPLRRGYPDTYSKFAIYSEAQRVSVPEPASAVLLLLTLPVVLVRRRGTNRL